MFISCAIEQRCHIVGRQLACRERACASCTPSPSHCAWPLSPTCGFHRRLIGGGPLTAHN